MGLFKKRRKTNVTPGNPDVVTEDPNADLQAARDTFKAQIGRDLSGSEWAWLTQKRGDIDKITNVDAVNKFLIPELQRATNEITQDASASGITLKPGLAEIIRDKYYVPGSADLYERFQTLYRNELSKLGLIQAKSEVQANIDKAKNPTISEEQKNTAQELIKGTFGRDATPQEIEFYSGELAQGVKGYEIQGQLQQTTEYKQILADRETARQTAMANSAQAALNAQLQQDQATLFQKASTQIIDQYLAAGRLNSSGLDNALAQAQKQLDQQRQSTLAGLNYQQQVQQAGFNQQNFVNNTSEAFKNYLNSQLPFQNRANAQNQSQIGINYQLPFDVFNRNQNFYGGLTGREQDISDYNRQKNDYERYFNQTQDAQNRAGLYQLYGSLLGSAGQGAAAYYGARRT